VSIYVASAILLVIAAVYAVLLKRKLAETCFLAAATVTGILYCFGLMNRQGCLLYGIQLIIALSAVCVLFLFHAFIKRRRIFYKAELLKGCLLYSSLLMFSVFIHYGRTFQGWDEFSHWGFIVKHFYVVDALGTVKHANYVIMFPAYFPGTSIFQYFFARFSGKFTEYYSYIGMNVMYFSLIMPFIKDIFIKEKLVKSFVLLAVFFMMPLTVSASAYSELYVDTMLGILFGFSLLYYFAYRYEESLYGILMVSAAVFLLTLTKDIGLLLSLIAIGVIAADMIFYRSVQVKNMLYKETGAINKAKIFLMLILPVISSLFVKMSWSNLLKRGNIQSIWRIPAINEACNFFSGKLEQHQKAVRYNFFDAMFQREIPCLKISVITFGVIITVVILFMSLLNSKKIELRRMVTSTLLLVMGLFGYQFVLALMYAFSFSPYEGLHLNSYERYTSTYMIAMMLFVMIFYVVEQNKRTRINRAGLEKMAALKKYIKSEALLKLSYFLKALPNAALLIAVMNITKGGIADTLLGRTKYSESFEPRPTAIAVEKWKPYFENENPYFIDQGSNGSSYFRMRYELVPYSKLANPTWGGDYSISTKPYYTEPYYANDIWTLIITPGEWEKYILAKGYKLLYVYKSDDILRTIYGHYFLDEVQDDMCYYAQNVEGHLVLVPAVE
jgi:hypothetical protein